MKTGTGIVAGSVAVAILIMAWGTLAVGQLAASPFGIGLSVTVDSHWVALDAHIGARNRGTAVREPAWAGAGPSRGMPLTGGVKAPNVIGRIRRNAGVIGTVADALRTASVRLIERASAVVPQSESGSDADRG